MTSRDPLGHCWTQICMEKSRHILSTQAPPLVFGTTWYWEDGKTRWCWAQGDSGFIVSGHSPSASSYIWLVEYNGGPDLLRFQVFMPTKNNPCFPFFPSRVCSAIHQWNLVVLMDKGIGRPQDGWMQLVIFYRLALCPCFAMESSRKRKFTTKDNMIVSLWTMP